MERNTKRDVKIFQRILLSRYYFGFGSIFNLAGIRPKKRSAVPDSQKDYLALKSDWEAIGNDIRSALRQCYER